MKIQKIIQNPIRFCMLTLAPPAVAFAVTGCFSLSSSSAPHTLVPAVPILPTATLAPTPIPTPIATLTPTPRWVEYQSALAKASTPYLSLCEWEILGQQGREVYVWALCGTRTKSMAMSAPAVIHLDAHGNVHEALFPSTVDYIQDISAIFPPEVQAKIWRHSLSPEIKAHFDMRSEDPNIPPLIVVSGTPLP